MSELEQLLNNILKEKTEKVVPENIKRGVTIFDVEGTLETGVDTTSAKPVTASEMVEGKEAFVNGEKVIGTATRYDGVWNKFPDLNGQVNGLIPVEGSSDYKFGVKATLQSEEGVQQPINGFLENADSLTVLVLINDLVKRNIGLTPEKIKEGEDILGVIGTLKTEGIDTTSDNPVTELDMAADKEAWVNGQKVVGKAHVVDSGESGSVGDLVEVGTTYSGSALLFYGESSNWGEGITSTLFKEGSRPFLRVDNEQQHLIAEAIGLTADKIKAGETVLGILGTYTGEEAPPEEEVE